VFECPTQLVAPLALGESFVTFCSCRVGFRLLRVHPAACWADNSTCFVPLRTVPSFLSIPPRGVVLVPTVRTPFAPNPGSLFTLVVMTPALDHQTGLTGSCLGLYRPLLNLSADIGSIAVVFFDWLCQWCFLEVRWRDLSPPLPAPATNRRVSA